MNDNIGNLAQRLSSKPNKEAPQVSPLAEQIAARLNAPSAPLSEEEGEAITVFVATDDSGENKPVNAVRLGVDGIRFIWEPADVEKGLPRLSSDMPHGLRHEHLRVISPGVFDLGLVGIRQPKRDTSAAPHPHRVD